MNSDFLPTTKPPRSPSTGSSVSWARGWDLGRAHGIDAPALVARLRRLGLAQTVAVVERLEAEGAARRAERDRAEAKVVAFPRRPHPSTRPTVR